MMKAGFGLCVAALALAGITGCATKNYVHKQTAPLIDHTNQLDEKTAANNRNLHDVDDRAQAGIKQAQGAADSATQNAQNATKAAGDAETAANDAVHRADSLDSVVKGSGQLQADGQCHRQLRLRQGRFDQGQQGTARQLCASNSASAKSYILEVTGGTDSIGSGRLQL